ncbi:MAG: hypothetical protein E7011_01925 [Alphaproteobacteria bacterium]|nr:hypothetical protein [Alphaproteobacteria bacterium]
MKKIITIFAILFPITLPVIAADTITVTGTVVLEDEEKNEPAVGAYVLKEGTKSGTYTDADGKFTLNDVPQGSNLQISFVGYHTQIIPAKANMGTIELKPDSEMLDDVVVPADIKDTLCPDHIIKGLNAKSGIWKPDSKNNMYCDITCDKNWTKKAGTYTIENKVLNKKTGKEESVKSTHPYKCECIGPRYKLESDICVDQVGKPCSTDKIATGKYKMDQNNLICVANTCKCGYEKKGDDCVPWDKAKCSTPIPNAKEVSRTCDQNGKEICKVVSCNDGYKPNTDGDGCVEKLKECTDDQKKEHPNATDFGIKPGTETCIALACKCGYDPTNGKCTEWPKDPATGKYTKPCTGTTKPSLPKNAKTGTMQCNGETAYCEVTNCNDGYRISDDKKSCTSIRGDQCDDDAKKIDSNATAGQFKRVGDKMTCVITACATGYNVNKDGTKCVVKNVLSQEDSQKKIDELTENAEKMREKEQSTENKLLGAAGIGAVGIGGMQLASAMAEQNADADAETAMRAYLSTFHCNYGGGINIAGGETDVELPGGNELIGLYSEYVNLANDLKTRKTALGMRPGIESEPILDSATSGLYDDISIGKTSGAYTSLARALMNPDGPDAIAWAQQKSDTAQKLKTGALTAGIGAVATLAGNQAINSGADKQDKSAKIAAEYEPLRKPFENAQKEFDSLPAKKCSEFAGTDGKGTSPNCTCNDPKTQYFHPDHGCQKCENDRIYNSTKKQCECPSDKPIIDTSGNCIEKSNNDCPLIGLVKNVDSKNCECIENTIEQGNECVCDSAKHFTESSGKCICENGYKKIGQYCLKEIDENKLNTDVKLENLNIDMSELNIEPFAELNISSDTAFKPSKSTITSEAKKEIEKFKEELLLEIALLPDGTEYCIYVTGHTDRTKFKQGIDMTNEKLSVDRANAVRDLLTTEPFAIAEENIISTGVGEQECKESIYSRDDPLCRKVSVSATTGKCQETPPKQ